MMIRHDPLPQIACVNCNTQLWHSEQPANGLHGCYDRLLMSCVHLQTVTSRTEQGSANNRMSSSAAASSYWRVAGMTYLKYSSLCAGAWGQSNSGLPF